MVVSLHCGNGSGDILKGSWIITPSGRGVRGTIPLVNVRVLPRMVIIAFSLRVMINLNSSVSV